MSPSRRLDTLVPKPEARLGHVASMNPRMSALLGHVGLLRTSPMPPTMPPLLLSSSCSMMDSVEPPPSVSLSQYALLQLMLYTTGSSAPLVRLPRLPVENGGSTHCEGPPWSRWTTRKRPALKALMMSVVVPFQPKPLPGARSLGNESPSKNRCGVLSLTVAVEKLVFEMYRHCTV